MISKNSAKIGPVGFEGYEINFDRSNILGEGAFG